MNAVLGQLRRWWALEVLVRAVWGLARWVAVALAALAVCCFVDWSVDLDRDTPRWVLAAGLVVQVALAASLAGVFLVRPLRRAPGLDDLATRAERSIPELGHRLVTALQLNRPGARTAGMSPALIAEVTREAGAIAARHKLARLARLRPLAWAVLLAAPPVIAAGVFAAAKPELTAALLKRQLLLDAEIPRSVRVTPETDPVWPAGSPVTLRFVVTGAFDRTPGTVVVRPENEAPSTLDLVFDHVRPDGSAVYTAVYPRPDGTAQPPSTPFAYTARLQDGRTRAPGRVDFEAPPKVGKVLTWKLLPAYLGTRPEGPWLERRAREALLRTDLPYEERQPNDRGELADVLPGSSVRIQAAFSKPVKAVTLSLIERAPWAEADLALRAAAERYGAQAPASGEVEWLGPAVAPVAVAADRLSAEWVVPTTPRTVGYRIDPVDDRGFRGGPDRHGVRLRADAPPDVRLYPERYWSAADWDRFGDAAPRPADPKEQLDWDRERDLLRAANDWSEGEPLAAGGKLQVTWAARSDYGVGRVRLAYRVVRPDDLDAAARSPHGDPAGAALGPGGWVAANPAALRQAVTHPSQDADWPERKRVFARSELYRWQPPVSAAGSRVAQPGRFFPELGLFETSDPDADEVEFHPLPPTPAGDEPGELQAAGRCFLRLGKLRAPDGTDVTPRPGDTVEVFVEVFDKLRVYEEATTGGSTRPAGYEREEASAADLRVPYKPGRVRLVRTPEEARKAAEAKVSRDRDLALKVRSTQEKAEGWLAPLRQLLNLKDE